MHKLYHQQSSISNSSYKIGIPSTGALPIFFIFVLNQFLGPFKLFTSVLKDEISLLILYNYNIKIREILLSFHCEQFLVFSFYFG